MQRIIVLALIGLFGWYGYGKYQERIGNRGQALSAPDALAPLLKRDAPTADSTYRCDGRIYCSQMTSCAEATFFLKNCPGTKMDGNNDGVPCERQWCK
jgi:hypothetical protein